MTVTLINKINNQYTNDPIRSNYQITFHGIGIPHDLVRGIFSYLKDSLRPEQVGISRGIFVAILREDLPPIRCFWEYTLKKVCRIIEMADAIDNYLQIERILKIESSEEVIQT